MNLTLAICIASHNRLPELQRTLPALAALEPAPDEIWVTADGCTDGTVDWVQREYPQIRLVIHPQARGSIASRTEMGLATTCDIFLSLDDDSYPIERDAVARLKSLFAANAALAVAEFPQRTDEDPESLTALTLGEERFIGSYANSGAAIRRSVFAELGGYPAFFFHAYEEPDFALRCAAAGWEVRFETVLTIRHHWTSLMRNEIRTHQRHARNEAWSAILRCPLPWLPLILLFRLVRQFAYALRRGTSWWTQEPNWWWQMIANSGPAWKGRRPISWKAYLGWMRLIRSPHNDRALYQATFGTTSPRPPEIPRSAS
jgi:GT2 family glycosyltransferase